MIVIRDNLWFCVDCMITRECGHVDDISDERAKEIERGFERLGPNVVPDNDGQWSDGHEEFSVRTCDCCQQRNVAGERFRYAILGYRYRCYFTARKIGAIGITCSFVEVVEASSPDQARAKLYERYEHIGAFACTDISHAKEGS